MTRVLRFNNDAVPLLIAEKEGVTVRNLMEAFRRVPPQHRDLPVVIGLAAQGQFVDCDINKVQVQTDCNDPSKVYMCLINNTLEFEPEPAYRLGAVQQAIVDALSEMLTTKSLPIDIKELVIAASEKADRGTGQIYSALRSANLQDYLELVYKTTNPRRPVGWVVRFWPNGDRK